MADFPIERVVAIVGREHVATDPEDLFCYAYDASKIKRIPACVAFPANAGEVSALVRLANEHTFPVFPRGAGSGMVGAAVPCEGGLVMALGRMDRILEIDEENMIATAEPGVVTATLQKEVAKRGFFYPPDPASLQFSTIGGNVAMCSGGPRAVKYGVTRDYVMALEAVLPTGEIVHTGTRTTKSVVGYDLTRLLVGCEGTLGVITKAVLRIIPAPEAVRTMTAIFSRLEDAGAAVTAMLHAKVIPSTVELMDQAAIGAVENYLHMGLPTDAEALLLIEVDGRKSVVDEEAALVEAACLRSGATKVERARDDAERERLWLARRSLSPATAHIKTGKLNEDVCVPRTQIPALFRAIKAIGERFGITIVSFGHAGDGNIHTNIMVDRKDREELRRGVKAVEELFKTVLELGGTLSGEHGIGIAKSPFFTWQVGPAELDAMRRIKAALDPLNILNPGKIFTPDRTFFDM